MNNVIEGEHVVFYPKNYPIRGIRAKTVVSIHGIRAKTVVLIRGIRVILTVSR